jgi:hypothetical protein
MNMPCVYVGGLGKTVQAKLEACRSFTAGDYVKGLGPGGGFFTLADSILPGGARQQAEYFNELQKIATQRTRLKIPLLQTEEGTHGLMSSGGTVFPEGPAIGSTWNTALVERIYGAAAMEARAVGIHLVLAKTVKPYRIQEAKIALECTLEQIVCVGEGACAGNLILGRIQLAHIQDDILINGREVDCGSLDALGRLSGNRYCTIRDVIESETN